MLDALFVARWAMSRLLAKTLEAGGPEAAGLPERLARRAARLRTFAAFPPLSTVTHGRDDVIVKLKAAMAGLADATEFEDF